MLLIWLLKVLFSSEKILRGIASSKKRKVRKKRKIRKGFYRECILYLDKEKFVAEVH